LALQYNIKDIERTKKSLVSLKNKSTRMGAWWKISHSERSIMQLAIKLKVKFTGNELLKAISSIVKKLASLLNTAESTLGRGARLAWVFSEKACEWGHNEALSWRYDCTYIEYLGKAFT
jgi:hypothetical protein